MRTTSDIMQVERDTPAALVYLHRCMSSGPGAAHPTRPSQTQTELQPIAPAQLLQPRSNNGQRACISRLSSARWDSHFRLSPGGRNVLRDLRVLRAASCDWRSLQSAHGG